MSCENKLMKIVMICIAQPVIEKNEMGGAYSAYGREERRRQSVGGET